MFTVAADTEKNRLRITLGAFVGGDEAKRILEQIVAEVGQLNDGFTVITDLSSFKLGASGAVPTLKAIVAFLSVRRVSHVVRVIGSRRTMGIIQFLSFVGKRPPYKTSYAASVEEAEAILDKKSHPVAVSCR